MKKLLICLLTVITAFSMNAQEKVTKLNVIGNWKIVSMELPGTVYYNLEIDSIAPREALLTQIGSGKDSIDALATMKTSLAMLKGMIAECSSKFRSSQPLILPSGTPRFYWPFIES